MNLKKNEIREIKITGMTTEGSGVGRIDNTAVFITNSAIGDVLETRIIKTAKNYAVGRIEKILSPSKERVEPDCDCFYQCGGCTYRHISYAAELAIKEQRVKDALSRIGGFTDIAVSPIIGAKERNGYRNKAQLPVGLDKEGKYITGFYAYHSHRIVPCDHCNLQPKTFTEVLRVFTAWCKAYQPVPYNELTHKGELRHLYIRQGEATGEIMVCLVLNGKQIKGEEALAQNLKETVQGFKGLVINTNTEKTNVILGKACRTVYGSDTITDTLCGVAFAISPLSFYQVNRAQTERLYALAKEYADLQGEEVLLDLYCGIGTIGLTMAKEVKELIGVEIIPQAVENAKENAKRNLIENARFICADAAKAAQQLKEENITPNVVVIDPPRKGCGKELIETIVQMNPARVVYVSCDPATLARDMKVFAEKGYQPAKVTPLDMFPCTPHVETVVLLSQRKADNHIEVDLDLDGLDVTSAESKATYNEIQQYVLKETGLMVSNLYIAQIKKKCGIDVGECFNKPKTENAKQPKCPEDKEKAIKDALKHFGMI